MTLNQIIKQGGRNKKFNKTKSDLLGGNPFKKVVCLSVVVKKPKKPNSADRKTVRGRIVSTGKEVSAYISGEGHNIREHSTILIRKGGARDCPGVDYTVIRGVYDVDGVKKRKNGRSKYGTKKA